MPLKDRELAVFREHLALTVGSLPRCPVCGNVDWQVAGLSELPGVPEKVRDLAKESAAALNKLLTALGNSGRLMRDTIPVVVMSCGVCCFTMQFDWAKILQKRGRK